MRISSEVKENTYKPICLQIFLECEKDKKAMKHVLSLLNRDDGSNEEHNKFIMDLIEGISLEIKKINSATSHPRWRDIGTRL